MAILGAAQESDGNLDLMKILFRNRIQRMLLESPPMQAPVQQKDFPTPPEMMAAAKQKQAVQAEQMAKEGGGQAPQQSIPELEKQATEQGRASAENAPPYQKPDVGRFLPQVKPLGMKSPDTTTIEEAPPEIPAQVPQDPLQAPPRVAPLQELQQEAARTPPPVKPYEPVPELEMKEATAAQRPIPGEYAAQHPVGRMRHIADILAGVGTGIMARNPWIGMQMTRDLDRGATGYTRAMQDWTARMGRVEPMAKAGLEQRQTEIDTQRAQNEAARVAAYGQNIQSEVESRLSAQQKIDEADKKNAILQQRINASRKPVDVRLKSGGKIIGAQWINGSLFGPPEKPGSPPAFIPPDNIDGVDVEGKTLPLDVFAYEQLKNELGRDPTSQELVDLRLKLHPVTPQDPRTPKLRADKLQESIEGAAKKEKEVGSEARSVANNALLNPRTFGEVTDKRVKLLAGQHFTRMTPGYPPPAKLTSDMEKRANAADISLEHAIQIEQFIADHPFLTKISGPIMGRLIKGEITAGDMPNLTPQEKQDLGELVGRFNSLLIQEVSTVTGGRSGKYLIEAFEKSTPNLKNAIEYNLGLLQQVRKVANITRVEASEHMFGGMGSVNINGQKVPSYQVHEGHPMFWDFKKKDWAFPQLMPLE